MAELFAHLREQDKAAANIGYVTLRLAGSFPQFFEGAFVIFEFLSSLGELTVGRQSLIRFKLLNRTID